MLDSAHGGNQKLYIFFTMIYTLISKIKHPKLAERNRLL